MCSQHCKYLAGYVLVFIFLEATTSDFCIFTIRELHFCFSDQPWPTSVTVLFFLYKLQLQSDQIMKKRRLLGYIVGLLDLLCWYNFKCYPSIILSIKSCNTVKCWYVYLYNELIHNDINTPIFTMPLRFLAIMRQGLSNQ